MGNIKRINLCFNLDIESHRLAYEVLINESGKTTFVVRKLIWSERDKITKDTIKEAIREVFRESNINGIEDVGVYSTEINEEIPEAIFDIFERL